MELIEDDGKYKIHKKKNITKEKKIWIFIFFLFLSVPIILNAQIIDTQVIDLAEKARNFFIEVTKGNIQGQITDTKFGENLGVSTVEQDIQSQGGVLTFLQSAQFISIISSDTVNDISSGSNARSVKIFGLDENFTKIEEVVNLSATATNTTKEYIRVYRLTVEDVGVYGNTNAGTITGTASLAETTQIEIVVGESQSETTHYTVPVGHELIMTSFRITMDTGKVIDVFIKAREDADDVTVPFKPIKIVRTFRGIATPLERINFGNNKFGEKTDIWITTLVSTGSAEVEANYDFLEYAIGT